MKPDAALDLYRSFAAEINDPVAAATLAGMVYRTERGAETASSPPDALWDVKQVAAYLNVSDKTVRRLVEKGRLKPAPLGIGSLRFIPDEVRRFARERPDDDGDGSILDDF